MIEEEGDDKGGWKEQARGAEESTVSSKSWLWHIWAHFDFLQNLRKFWWFHPIFTNFGDIFVEKFVESPKFSLYFVNNFVPNLVTFFEPKNVTNFGDFFWDYFFESLKLSLFLVIDFSPILSLFFSQYMFTNFGDFFLEFFCES